MSEQKKPESAKPEAKPEVKTNMLDTTKDGVKLYLEDAGATFKAMPYSAKAMRLAVVRFILDSAAIEDRELRAKVWKQFNCTPSWFGCNNSAGRQALGYKTPEANALAEIDDV